MLVIESYHIESVKQVLVIESYHIESVKQVLVIESYPTTVCCYSLMNMFSRSFWFQPTEIEHIQLFIFERHEN
jgi:hypothetical protein